MYNFYICIYTQFCKCKINLFGYIVYLLQYTHKNQKYSTEMTDVLEKRKNNKTKIISSNTIKFTNIIFERFKLKTKHFVFERELIYNDCVVLHAKIIFFQSITVRDCEWTCN